MAVELHRFNIRDTKKYYTQLNELAVKGIEVITYNGMKAGEEVSHIARELLDFLMSKVMLTPVVHFDEELEVYTASVEEIEMWGEGVSREQAIQNLVDCVLHYLEVYLNNIELFRLTETPEKRAIILKLLRCGKDRELLRKTMGF